MESDMVDNDTLCLYPQDCLDLVMLFFSKEFKNFELTKSGYYTGYWWLHYVDIVEDVTISFDGDIGGHFFIDLIISGTKYSLWQFDRNVDQVTDSCKKNILYQLNVLKQFLK
ncbi:hypothetical protein FACS189455_4080 [Bacteroidia bacterium]|nr:hypothetical protein FACS189455_4080 [Bacteroidia bacterium]